MTRVITSPDCGNSPKNLFLQKLTIALVKGDNKFILSSVTEDISWTIIGNKRIQGKTELAEALAQRAADKPLELTVQHVVSHGKAGAVNGTLKMQGGKTRAFCHVFEFGSAKGTSVQAITSYVVETRGV